MGIPTERYSKITDKNQREICLHFPAPGANARSVITLKTTAGMRLE